MFTPYKHCNFTGTVLWYYHRAWVTFDWDPAICITYSTDYYQRFTLEGWFTKLEQTPLNRSQQLTKRRTNYLLTRSSKTNYDRITGELTI